ncbi:Hypothetical protein PBC10988_3990 [Planctomycetales bacterium 10988]|nr:Hypothetical protein PBC10988_3990 [Planctomycetales bacterium 10988]
MGQPISASVAERIRQEVERFQEAIQSGQSPRIEDFLPELPEPGRPFFFLEALQIELLAQNGQASPSLKTEYSTRFPEFQDVIDKVFQAAYEGTLTHQMTISTEEFVKENIEQDLLFGIFAVQTNFLSEEELITVLNDWLVKPADDLGQLLIERGDLDQEAHDLLQALVQKHLVTHKDPSSIGPLSIKTSPSLHHHLQKLRHPALKDSLDSLFQYILPAEGTEPSENGTTGEKQGRFHIIKLHDKGGLGEVFLAQDEEVPRQVALKQIRPDHAKHAESRSRFLREAQITGALEHPGIVPVYGLGFDAEQNPYYAMRFIRGISLSKAIEEHFEGGPFDTERDRILDQRRLLRTFIDACNAMEYAHSRGILHRDMKPSNIMLGKYGETLVVDWGLAKPVGRGDRHQNQDEETLQPRAQASPVTTQQGSTVGTPAYMSPEQAAGQVESLTPASDVYSLGATLYQILTGIPPITGKDVDEMLLKVIRGEFPKPRQVRPNIPRSLEAVCLQAMSLEPGDRYQTPKALAEDIERWMADESVEARNENTVERLARWSRRHRAWTFAGVAALVLIAVSSCIAVFFVNAAKQEADRAQGIAEQTSERAKRFYSMSNEVVADFVVAITENRRQAANRPFVSENSQQEWSAFQEKLLDRAREFYEELTEEAPADPELEFERARGYLRLGDVKIETGHDEEALKYYQLAERLQTRLVNTFPEEEKYLVLLASIENNLAACLPFEEAEKRLEHFEYAQQLLDQIEGEEELATTRLRAIVAWNLGYQYFMPNNLEKAKPYFDRSIQIYQDLVRKEPGDYLYSSELAGQYDKYHRIYDTLEMRDKSVELLTKAIETREQILNTHPDLLIEAPLAMDLHNRGFTFKQIGQLDDAIQDHLRAAELYSHAIEHDGRNPARSGLAQAYHNLALIYDQREEIVRATTYYEQAIALRERLVKDDPEIRDFDLRKDIAFSYHQWAYDQAELGYLKQAREGYSKAIEYREILVDRQPTSEHLELLAISYHNRGFVYQEEKKYKESLADYEESLRARRRLLALEPDYPLAQSNYAHTLGNCGWIAYHMESYEDAIDYFQRAIEAYRDHVQDAEETHWKAGIIINYRPQVLCYIALNDRQSAKILQREIIQFCEETIRKKSPEPLLIQMSDTLQNLGYECMEKDWDEYSIPFSQESVRVRKRVLDKQELPNKEVLSDQGQAYHNLALGYEYIDESQKAIEAYTSAIQSRQNLYDESEGEFRQGLAFSHYNRAVLYFDQGNYSEALADYTQAIEFRMPVEGRKLSSEQKAELADAYDSRQLVYYQLGQYQQAIEDCQKALHYYLQNLEEQRELSTITSCGQLYHNAGIFYYALGDAKASKDSYLQAIALREEAYLMEGNDEIRLDLGYSLQSLMYLEEELGNLEGTQTNAQKIVDLWDTAEEIQSPDILNLIYSAKACLFGIRFHENEQRDVDESYQAFLEEVKQQYEKYDSVLLTEAYLIALLARSEGIYTQDHLKAAIDCLETGVKTLQEASKEDQAYLFNPMMLTYNGLAWIRATAPFEELRNGEQAKGLAEQVCQMTGFEAPLLLDTYAAAWAELGDFEKAVKWQQEAVDRAYPEVLEELNKHLTLYQEQKPYREELATPPGQSESEQNPAEASDTTSQKTTQPVKQKETSEDGTQEKVTPVQSEEPKKESIPEPEAVKSPMPATASDPSKSKKENGLEEAYQQEAVAPETD